jgi:Tfp pilus assembly protein PilP
MKLMTSILAVAVMTSGAWAQNPNIINNVKGKIDTVQQQKAADSDAALNAAGVPATQPATKPAASAAPNSGAAQTAPAKAPTTAAKAAPAGASKTAPKAAIKPSVAAKTAPSTKPAVAAKAATAPAKPAAPSASKATVVSTTKAPAAQTKNSAPVTAAAKPHDIFSPKPGTKAPKEPHWAPVTTAETAVKPASKAALKPSVPTTKIAAVESPDDAAKIAETPKAPKPEEKKWAMTGKRDPFFSPIVQQSNNGSGCSTGKKCLEIGQINVRGVVKSDGGFIAVVTNSLNKAYFLHESDPVFNGYVLKITGDSVVFQENVQDKFGKPLTREVVKRILTPAV